MPGQPHKIAIVGLGKIARDQHLPSIARSDAFELAAIVSRNASLEGIDHFETVDAMLAARPDIDCVSFCTPPQVRFAMARDALAAGRHVMLEKPPGATLSEVETLRDLAQTKQLSLLATWHSRYAPAVEPARQWLADKEIESVEIVWREDVRRWHPGQAWIWEAGGLGVFDPAINGLSILTRILPNPFHVTEATLEFPENCQTPIAAQVQFQDSVGVPISGDFDWLQTGPQSWNIEVRTRQGTLRLEGGGARMLVDGALLREEPEAEYDGLYARFAEILTAGESDVDVSPLRQVADAFLLGRRKIVEAFVE